MCALFGNCMLGMEAEIVCMHKVPSNLVNIVQHIVFTQRIDWRVILNYLC